MTLRERMVSSGRLVKAALLAAHVAAFIASNAALAAEKRDLSGTSSALARLQQMTTGLQFMENSQLGSATQQALGLETGASLQLERINKLPNGKEIYRFEQKYRGIPIWGERVLVTRNPDGSVEKLGGKAIYDVGAAFADAMPAMTSEQALEKAKNAASEIKGGTALKSIRDASVRQVVYVADSGSTHIAFEVSFLAQTTGAKEEPTRPFVMIDARTGSTLLAWEGLAHEQKGTGPGGNQKTGRYEYGSGKYPALEVTVNGKQCSLKGANVITEDMGNRSEGNALPFVFPCFRNTAKEVNGALSALNDAHFFGTLIYEMYNEWYGVPPLSFPLHMRVHADVGSALAHWDGQQMSFGDGDKDLYPLVVPDVAAHEIAHGFTEQHSNLTYFLESGGINEAFSDMAGEAFEYYLAHKYPHWFGRNMPDYVMGAGAFKAPNRALRDLCTPEKDGRSIGHVKDYRAGMDVHNSSGVFNKAFCLLAKTTGWDTKKAFDVFFVANSNFWVPNSTFVTAAKQAAEAADSLDYGRDAVAAAFKQVGIDLPVVGTPPVAVAAQTQTGRAGGAITLAHACSYYGETLPEQLTAYTANDEAKSDEAKDIIERIIQRIVDVSGMARNFEILAAPVPNAAAATQNGIRYILYNPAFVSELDKLRRVSDFDNLTRTDWAKISIMAHEVGHHANGHTLTPGGGRPQLELEADFFSGHILQRLGGSLSSAKAAMEQFGSATGSLTHPAKDDRLAAITSGWMKECENDPYCHSEPDPAAELDGPASLGATPGPSDHPSDTKGPAPGVIHQLEQ